MLDWSHTSFEHKLRDEKIQDNYRNIAPQSIYDDRILNLITRVIHIKSHMLITGYTTSMSVTDVGD